MGLAEVTQALERAMEAADQLGLETSDARAVAGTIAERSGYPSDLYVLALAGGTGVGKSSLLNAIAGEEVSAPGVRRPTTSTPLAWLPASQLEHAGPLLEWLGGADVRTRSGHDAHVAIVDLPDLDSIEAAHAARVDALLPRVDAVLWVTDPEKYDDAILHDGYLRRWMPRLGHQAIVLNKVDRLATEDVARVAEDLTRRLASEALPVAPVLAVSAIGDVEAVRTWLDRGVEAKEVMSARLRSSAAEAVRWLASAAGVDGPDAPSPLVAPGARSEAISRATLAVLDVVDLEGLREQAMAATRAQARSSGGSPIEVVRNLAGRASGASQRTSDPEGYLRRWRERGSLDRAVGPIRHLLLDELATLPAAARPAIARAAEPTDLADRLARGIDAVVTSPEASIEAPSSRMWPLIGLGQLIATAAVVVGVVWLVTLWVAGGNIPTPTLDVPVLGAMPTPAVLILVGLLGWFAFGRSLRWHAGRLGRRWADRLGEAIGRQVTAVVGDTIGRTLDTFDASRHDLWSAWQDIVREGRRDA